jgi:hypothetical protein
MATPQDLLDKVAAQKTVVASLKVFIDDLLAKLAAAIAAGGGVMTQAQLDAVVADVTADNQAIADAMVANTPNAP